MPVDFWAETASPVKNPLKDAFLYYAEKLYERRNVILSSYFPFVMGGDMPASDYLVNMDLRDVPDNYFTMGFGECSTGRFYEKFIKSGIYTHSKIISWFPETMVVDTKRLGSRPLPESFFDLTHSCYRGEVCIIGSPEVPDPLAALFIYKQLGIEAAKNFIYNIAGFGAPVNAIRHIGKSSNNFGSIFIMPLFFANVCRELKHVAVIQMREGYFAEPFILFSKAKSENKNYQYINEFVKSQDFKEAFSEKSFFMADEKTGGGKDVKKNFACLAETKIFPLCKNTYFPELEFIFPMLREVVK